MIVKQRQTPPPLRRGKYFVINVTLPMEDNEFLQWVGNQTRRQGGYFMPKTMILRGMTRVLKQIVDTHQLDLTNITTEDEFVERLMLLIRKKANGVD